MAYTISGFSKLSKQEKIDWLGQTYLQNSPSAVQTLQNYWHADSKLQKLHDEFTENTLSNFYLPFGIAPNFRVNGKNLAIPMAVEESSVIAAAGKAAKFWNAHGGFKAEVLGTTKIGHVHFSYSGDPEKLKRFFEETKPKLMASVSEIIRNMEKRGGGVLDIELKDKTGKLANYYQLLCSFETKDAMGANFINTCLEQFGTTLEKEAQASKCFSGEEKNLQVIMSILSNYVPDCHVRAEVSCPVEDLGNNEDGHIFAEKFLQAIRIAEVEPSRAVTHNKGIMNGIDAVVLATGNDFRAVEAGIHAFAAKDGRYTSLTHAEIKEGIFHFWIEIPIALGTVGGLTSLHPLAQVALEILQKPSAKELMEIAAVAGLAQNFAAVHSLITTGIQKGHMKMHLMNILNQQHTTSEEKSLIIEHFKTHTITHSAVIDVLQKIRNAE
ncbi:MAG TPA: hydroxymethylglutaryl-CoA reductase, degradative [Flavobacteriaceae bacterium]|nr:hydroxymethylglutaryl-CoA reductase, degradative [Flavobacteriaceae bacterium]